MPLIMLVLSISLGFFLAILNISLGMLTARKALRYGGQRMLKIMFSWMGIRMIGLLLITAGVLWWVPVQVPAFVGALIGGYIVGLIVEVFMLKRYVSSVEIKALKEG